MIGTTQGHIRCDGWRFPIVHSGWTGNGFSVVGRLPGPMRAGGGRAQVCDPDGNLLWWSPANAARWGPAGVGDSVDVVMTITFDRR